MEIDFKLDEILACLWIESKIDRFRINCSDLSTMKFWAAYWYSREFPFSHEKERASFRVNLSMFLDRNKEKIEELSREIAGARITHLVDLDKEIHAELARARRQAVDGEILRKRTAFLERV